MAIRNRVDFESAALRLPPGYLETIRILESGGGRYTVNSRSSARGDFQFIESTFNDIARRHPWANLTDRTDPQQSRLAAAIYAIENAEALRSLLGRAPTGEELYLAHHFGAGGARRILSNPEGRLTDAEYRANPVYNGMTAGEVFEHIKGRYNTAQRTIPDVMGGRMETVDPLPFNPAAQGALAQGAAPMEKPDPLPALAAAMAEQAQPQEQGLLDRWINGMFGRGGILGSPEAMAALAAGILSGRGPSTGEAIAQGLGQGIQNALAVSQRARQEQRQAGLDRATMMTAVAKLIESGVPPNIAAQMVLGGADASGLAGALSAVPQQTRVSASDMYVDDVGTPIREVVGRDGTVTYINTLTGQRGPTFRAVGAVGNPVRMPVSATGLNRLQQDGVEQMQAILNAAREAPARIAELDRLAAIGPSVVGSDYGTVFARWLAQATGVNIGQVTPENVQEVQQRLAGMQLRSSDVFRGQGQVTEYERRILAESLPNIFMNPTAFNRAINVMRAVEERRAAIGELWNRLSPAEKNQLAMNGIAMREWIMNAERQLREEAEARQRENPNIFGPYDPNARFNWASVGGSRSAQAGTSGTPSVTPAPGAPNVNGGTITDGSGRTIQWRRVQ